LGFASLLVAASAIACSSSASSSGDGDAGQHLDVTPLDTPPADAAAPRHVKCGRTDVCDLATMDCCARPVSGSGLDDVCIPRGGDCDGTRITCDGPEDCDGGQVCCETAGGGATTLACTTADACASETGFAVRLCHLDDDCVGAALPHCCFS